MRLLLSRRQLVLGTTTVAASVLPAFRVKSGDFDNPPVLSNGRHQFEVLVPPRQLPSIWLPSLDGKDAKVEGASNKILLVNFWATWCAACRVELPMLAQAQVAMRGLVSVITISTDEGSPAKILAYLQSLRTRSLKTLIDNQGRLSKAGADHDPIFPLYGMPITYLITPSGRIAGLISGATDWMAPDAQQLLAYYAGA